MSDSEAVARLTSRLLQLDIDAATLEILLAALTADEATTTEPAWTSLAGDHSPS
jgi:hypothetical protein